MSVTDSMVNKEDNQVVYALAPVWILTTRYEDKPYTFMMNGQTGKFVGTLPYDHKKSWMYMLGATAVLTPLLYFAAKLVMK